MATAKILAVDDSATMRSLVQQTLGLGGYEVILAVNGREGMEKLDLEPVDLVITDINMPVMDGISFIKEVRKKNQTIPILTLTTESEEDIKRQGAEAGANGWIIKPFRPVQFLDIIKQVLH
ncbi:response regulator receiver domain protein [Leptospira fainei serovar Hurstbridge str. BUT 6]|uniref:Response regulator receiver domain protein n=1 Tax=Leptospira fainei serovar Hurstbridge str. BUT 6 TaxID=1193011 RepID=S3V003_9LEPT|nr:response regulator [Leptospira fainei]EPG75991.1 response regulator receiver domain protein [Leptospira fainei serovar Hurstbridge str. BUT 6]